MKRLSPVALAIAVGLLVPNATSGQAPRGKIAFNRHSPSGYQLYISNDDGSGLCAVATIAGPVEAPRWSRDGKQIAFIAFDQLYVVEAACPSQPQLINPHVSGVGLTWDNAGTGLIYGAFCTCCEYLATQPANGSGVPMDYFTGRRPVRDIDVRPGDSIPSDLVAYGKVQCGSLAANIELTRKNGVDFSQISLSSGVDRQIRPRWSADGKKLVTIVRFAGTNDHAIEVLDALDLTQRRQYLRNKGEFQAVDFGCTENTVFFAWTDPGGSPMNVFRFDLPSGPLKRITNLTSGSINKIDHFCTTDTPGGLALPDVSAALVRYTTVFDQQAWAANAQATAGQLFPQLPENLVDLLEILYEEAVSAASPAAGNLLAARDAIQIIVLSWQNIQVNLTADLLNDMDAITACQLPRTRSLKTVLSDFKASTDRGQLDADLLNEARQVSSRYYDMLTNPGVYDGCAPLSGTWSTKVQGGVLGEYRPSVNGLKQAAASLLSFLNGLE